MNWTLPQYNGNKHSCPSSSRGAWRHISHREAAPPGSQVVSGTKMSLPEPHLFRRGTRESVASSLSGCMVLPMPFLLSWLKFYVTFSQQTPVTTPKQAEITKLVFQAMIFSQEIDVECSQFYTSISSSSILPKEVWASLFLLHCFSSPHVTSHITLLFLVSWIFKY